MKLEMEGEWWRVSDIFLNLCNMSFENWLVPEDWRVAVVHREKKQQRKEDEEKR